MADVELIDYSMPDTVEEFETFSISLTLKNVSDSPNYDEGYILIDYESEYRTGYVAKKGYGIDYLEAGETKTVTLEFSIGGSKYYDVTGDFPVWASSLVHGWDEKLGILTVTDAYPPQPEPDPADFSFDNLRYTKDNEIIKPKVDVTNTGDESGDILVKFMLGGNEVTNSGTVSIDSGNTKTLSGAFIPIDSTGGEICAVEDGGDAEICDTFDWGDIIDNLKEGSIGLPDSVKVDESLDCIFKVINDGDISKDGEITCSVNGNQVDMKTVTVPPNDEKTVIFDLLFEKSGDYEVCCSVQKTLV